MSGSMRERALAILAGLNVITVHLEHWAILLAPNVAEVGFAANGKGARGKRGDACGSLSSGDGWDCGGRLVSSCRQRTGTLRRWRWRRRP